MHRRVARILAYLAAASIGPVVLLLASISGEEPAGPIDIHSLPVYYNGTQIEWQQASSILRTRKGLTLDIDVRHETNQRVVIFDSSADYQSWLCKKRYVHAPC
jgi:hypothetical protein